MALVVYVLLSGFFLLIFKFFKVHVEFDVLVRVGACNYGNQVCSLVASETNLEVANVKVSLHAQVNLADRNFAI
jgi:hypothetical protein